MGMMTRGGGPAGWLRASVVAAPPPTTAANAQVSETGQRASTSLSVATARTSAPSHAATQGVLAVPELPGGTWHYVNWYIEEGFCIARGLTFGIQGYAWYCQPVYVGPFIAAWWLYIWY